MAAILVVLYHAARHIKADLHYLPFAALTQFGHAGVDFFFVLSGFIIFYVHRKDVGVSARLRIYFARRFTRIYPLFWFSLLAGLVLTALSSTHPLPAAGAFLYMMTLLPTFQDVGVAWTLQHEILFYLLFSLLLIHRRLGGALFLLWFAAIVTGLVQGYAGSENAWLARLLSPYNIEFFLGMLAAFIVQGDRLKTGGLVFGLGVAGFLATGLAENFALFDGYAVAARLLYGLCSMLIVIGIAKENLRGRLHPPRVLTRLGGASYSIYLFHFVFIGVSYKIMAVAGLLGRLPVGIVYLVTVGGGILGGMIVSRMVEYPLMTLIRKIGARPRKSGSDSSGNAVLSTPPH